MMLYQSTDPGDPTPALPGAEDLDRRRRAKWLAGRIERGLSLRATFDGNPAKEGRLECEDQANYAEECVRQGDATAEELEWAYPLILQLDLWFAVVQERRARRLSA